MGDTQERDADEARCIEYADRLVLEGMDPFLHGNAASLFLEAIMLERDTSQSEISRLRSELERARADLERAYEKDDVKTREINILTRENRNLYERLASSPPAPEQKD
jgi:hypothetical protein